MAKATTHTNSGSSSSKSMFDKFESWTAKNEKKLFYSFLTLTLFFSLALFNVRFSEANDDSGYIEAAWKYVNDFPNFYFTFNAPLYPMFLAVIYKVFGFHIMLFKLINVVLYFFSVFLFWKALYKKVPAVIFMPVMLFISINYLMMYFASMTFTEAFYLFFQSLLFFVMARFFDLPEDMPFKGQIKYWLIIGLLCLLLSISKNIAILVVPALMFVFIIQKDWKKAGLMLLSYAVFRGIYELLVKSIWGSVNQFSGQGNILMLKDPYDKSLGNDDLSGFIGRFFDNSNLYLSKRFFQIIGFREEKSTEVYGFLAFLMLAIIIVGAIIYLRQKNKLIQFVTVYTVGIMMASFVALQARWDQPRIILVCMPVLFIIIYNLFYISVKKHSMGQLIYIAIIGVICISMILSTLKRSSKNIPIAKKNLSGNIYEGYTPDWQNFLKCSQWCKDSLPEDSYVASRKAPMSFIYGKGKKFFPIYSVIKKDPLTQQSNPDSALAYFKTNHVTHLMLASLRLDPEQNTGQFINTIHNIAQPIMNKYPNMLTLVHTEGFAEQTYLFKINY
ncbi:MAG: hypothetical protein V4506_11335 [Bacteroidota bacterium]